MAQSKIGVAGAWWKWNGVGDRITHIIYIHTAHFGIHLDYHFRFQYFKLTYRYNVAMFVFKVQYEIIMFFRVKYIGGLQTYDAVLCRSTNL
jgi:hypothetical protein